METFTQNLTNLNSPGNKPMALDRVDKPMIQKHYPLLTFKFGCCCFRNIGATVTVPRYKGPPHLHLTPKYHWK